MNAGSSSVQYVGFSLLGDEEHQRRSFVTVRNYELFQGSQPVPQGVYDLCMGTTDHHYRCLTCAHGKKLCTGHPGDGLMRVPVQTPIAVGDTRKWARIICIGDRTRPGCGNLLVDLQKYASIPAAKRLNAAAQAPTDGRKCKRCGVVHPKVIKDAEDYITFWAEDLDEKRWKLYPYVLKAAFEKIPDSVVEALGKPIDSHPRKMILRVIQIPPNSIRPGVKSYGAGATSYHDITNMLQHIVKRNGQIPEQIPPVIDDNLDRYFQNLQQIYYDYIKGSNSTSVTQGSSGKRGIVVGTRSAPSILRRLPRKRGRIRDNLLGKRVFIIGRNTISGNTTLRPDQVGVPMAFARTLQIAERVQEFNKDFLMQFFLNGRRQYPGCTRIVKGSTGDVHEVEGLRRDFQLEVGDVIYRDLVTGDIVYFNRQPTLEKSSIGVHEVVVIEDPTIQTFQMNVLACEWYNADFDGDQMSIWPPHDPMTRAEARLVSAVHNNFISTKTSGPVNGQVQDSLFGSAELTRSDVQMDKYHAMALFQTTGLTPPRFEGDMRTRYTGREVVSMLFQHAPVNYSRVPSFFNEVYASSGMKYEQSEIRTVMERGNLGRGVCDKKAVGAKQTGGLFHLVSREYGPVRALAMVYALQQMAIRFLENKGMTVGGRDILITREAQTTIHRLIAEVLLESRNITDRLIRGEIIPPIGKTTHEFYEELQINALKPNDRELMRAFMSSIDPRTNGLFKMVSYGSKGNNANLINICCVINQVLINAERIREQFAFRRTLPYFPRFATDPFAYGFMGNSYASGMTSVEFIFNDMNGRFDLINKALSTASTGYFMRKGVMNNQSSLVDNLRHVSKDTKIVQILYGEDGLEPRQFEPAELRSVPLSNAALRDAFHLDLKGSGAVSGSADEISAAQKAVDDAYARIAADRDEYRRIGMRVERSNFRKQMPTDILVPVNVARIVSGVFIAAGDSEKGDETAEREAKPVQAKALRARIERVEDLCSRTAYLLINEIQERLQTPIPAYLKASTFVLNMLLRSELSPKVLARMSDDQLTYVIQSVRTRYSMSLIAYGSAVGILAAQAISEPLTQYMLDSHHRSVAGGTNKAGLVRVSEIYGARPVEDEQSPSMLLPIKPEFATDVAKAQEIANGIELVTLRRFVKQYDILFEPFAEPRYPPFRGDVKWMREFETNHPLVKPPPDLTSWCYRLVLDKGAMVLKAVGLEQMTGRLRTKHPSLFVVHTPESVPHIVVRIYVRASQFKRNPDDEDKAKDLLESVLDTTIRGVDRIMLAKIEKNARTRVNEDGSLGRDTDAYAVTTVGTNLYGCALNKYLDSLQILSSSIGDTYKMFGIEAARNKIITETRSFMEDNTPNLRHLMLYASEMCRTGRVTSLERGGLAVREKSNVLLRMAASAPIQVVEEAALNGAKGRVYGIAAPQMLGDTPKVGTLYNEFTVDDEFVAANAKSVDSVLADL